MHSKLFNNNQIQEVKGAEGEWIKSGLFTQLTGASLLHTTIRERNGDIHCYCSHPVKESQLGDAQKWVQSLTKSFVRGGSSEARDTLGDIVSLIGAADKFTIRVSEQRTSLSPEERTRILAEIAQKSCVYGYTSILKRTDSFVVHEPTINPTPAHDFILTYPLPNVADREWVGDCAALGGLFLGKLRNLFPGDSFNLLEYSIPRLSANVRPFNHFQIEDRATGIKFDGSEFFAALVKDMKPTRCTELTPAVPFAPSAEHQFSNRSTYCHQFQHGGDLWCSAVNIQRMPLTQQSISHRAPGTTEWLISISLIQTNSGNLVRECAVLIPTEYTSSCPLNSISHDTACKIIQNCNVFESSLSNPEPHGTTLTDPKLISEAADILGTVCEALKRGQIINKQVDPKLTEVMISNLERLRTRTFSWWR